MGGIGGVLKYDCAGCGGSGKVQTAYEKHCLQTPHAQLRHTLEKLEKCRTLLREILDHSSCGMVIGNEIKKVLEETK